MLYLRNVFWVLGMGLPNQSQVPYPAAQPAQHPKILSSRFASFASLLFSPLRDGKRPAATRAGAARFLRRARRLARLERDLDMKPNILKSGVESDVAEALAAA